MPWITTRNESSADGGNGQRISNSPEVIDLYKSPNVFANNVAVVIYNKPGTSTAFSGDTAVPAVPVNQGAATQMQNLPSAPMPAVVVNQNAIEAEYQGTGNTPSTTVNGTTAAAASEIVPFLTQLLGEAEKGMWDRVNPAAPKAIIATPGNENIVNCWTSIGITWFKTDQVAWCAAFVNFVLKRTGHVFCPEGMAGAIRDKPSRWKATPVSFADALPGDIVLWDYGGGQHVNFVYTLKNGRMTFVGGNQTRGVTPTSNNPSGSTVSEGWIKGGWTPSNDGPGHKCLGFWRPSKG